MQYSLLSRGPAQEEVRASCRDLGIQMIAYSPLALGMLVGECTAWLQASSMSTSLLRRHAHGRVHGMHFDAGAGLLSNLRDLGC